MTNSGVFIVTKNSTLIRRQTSPKLEELEFGVDAMIVRRDGRTAKRPIPKRFEPLLATLQAIILGQPDLIGNYYQSDLELSSNGWSVVLTTASNRKETLKLSGCGALLQELKLTASGDQDRLIRFIAP